METTITATELARNLSDILNRVRYRGERFRVEKNGEAIAVIEPSPRKARTFAELSRRLQGLEWPVGFADDLEKVIRDQPPMSEPPSWPS